MPISASSIINSEVRGYTGSIGYVGSRGTSDYTVSNTAPVSARVGDRWLDSNSGIEYTYLNDGDGNVWVELGSISATAAVNGLLASNLSFGTNSSTTIAFNSQIASDLIPSANETYSLGSATNRWANVYLAANTINLGNVALSASNGQLVLPSNVKIGNAFIDGTSGGTVNTSTAATGSVPKISTITYPGNDTAADPAGGQTITLTGSGFQAGASIVLDGVAVGVVSVVNTTTITFTAPAKSAGSYIIYVINTDGGTAIAIPGIQYSGIPTWSTTAGNIGGYVETTTFNNTLTATGDAPITYSLQSGTLPPGATLNANGTVTGTSQLTGSPTTYTFTVRASDAQNQDTDRSFSITVNPDTVTWSSPAAATEYSLENGVTISNVTLSASSAAGSSITYTANALPTGLSVSGATISGTPTGYTENTTVATLLTANATSTTRTATRSISWVVQIGDTYFNLSSALLQADSGSFIADASTNSFAISISGDTRPSRLSPYWPGGWSVLLDGSSNYITFNAFTGVGAWTVEFWLYMLVTPGTDVPIASQGQSDSTGNFIMWMTNTRTLMLYSNGSICQTSASVPLNQWSHIAFVSNASNNVTIYIDGVSSATGTYSGKTFNSTPFQINRGYGGVLNGTNYYMSNFRMVKGTAVYTANFTPSTTALSSIAGTEALLFRNQDLKDYSANNYTLTTSGSAPIRAFSPFNSTPYSVTSSWEPNAAITNYSYSSSLYGASAYFDGTGDKISVPYSTALDFGTGDFTIEFWMYPQSQPSQAGLWIQSTGPAVFGPIWLVYESGVMKLYATTANGSWNIASQVSVSSTIPMNSWTHFALTRSSGVWKSFVNGSQFWTITNAGSLYVLNTPIYIGAFADDSRLFTGYLSNYRAVKGTAVYTANFNPPTAPLTAVANTTLLTLQADIGHNNNLYVDHSGHNHLITRNGNTTQGSLSPLIPSGWSGYFDGSGDFLSLPTGSTWDFGTGNFTIEFWMYPSGTSGSYARFFQTGDGDVYTGVGISRDNAAENILVSLSSNGSNYDISNAQVGFAYDLNIWTHFALVRNGNNFRVYKNGIQTAFSATSSSSIYYNAGYVPVIGGQTGSRFYSGYLSNFRIVKGTALYTANFTPATATLSSINNTSLFCLDGPTLTDRGPNNFAITRNGDVTITPFSPFKPHSIAPKSYSVYFDGTGDYLTLTANAAFVPAGDFTLECWVYRTASAADYTIAGYSSASSTVYSLKFNTSGNIIFLWYNNSTTAHTATSSTTVTANTWHHVAVTFEGSNIKLWVNGSLSHTVAFTGSTRSVASPSLGIGSWGSSTTEPQMLGYVSNFRIVKGTAVYTANFTPATTALTSIANTSLLTCQSSTIIDNSTNAFAITVNGDARPRSFNPFGDTVTAGVVYSPATHGGSAYFDGSGDYLTIDNNVNLRLDNDFTIEFWFYPITTTFAGLAQYRNGAAWSSGDFQFHWDSNTVTFYTPNGSVATATMPIKVWNHIAISRSGSTISAYLNGVRSNTWSNSTVYTGNGGLFRIGELFDGTHYYFNGYISNFRVVKGTSLYNGSFVPNLTAPTITKDTSLLVNFTNGGIVDGTGRTVLETVGDARVNTSVKKYGSGSMSFDGTGDYLYSPWNPVLEFFSGNFTIEFWAYIIGGNSLFCWSTDYHYGMTFNYAGSGGNRVGVWASTNGSSWNIFNADGGGNGISTGTITLNTWTHIAWVRNGSSWALYLNGTSAWTGTSSASIISRADTFRIGGPWPGAGPTAFNGYIDDFRITNGAARYTTNFTPPALHQNK